MKLSEGIEWGIHCCSFLTAIPEGYALTGAKLSEFFDLPRDYLAKHLQAMSRANILATSKGPKGGYCLARPADQISLLDIVEAIDGKDPSFRCSEIRRRGPAGLSAEFYKKPCGIARAMWRAEHVWRSELKKVTIAHLAKDAETDVHDEQQSKATHWLVRVLGVADSDMGKGNE